MRFEPRPGAAASGYARVVPLMLVVLVLVVWPRLQGEWRFFQPGSLVSPDGSAPVLQDDAADPAADAAFRAAAAHLPANATCVIARNAWYRDYFRATYLLMPRRVWPAVDDPRTPITSAVLKDTVLARHASCLLIPPGSTAPAGFRQVTAGTYALYMPPHPEMRPL